MRKPIKLDRADLALFDVWKDQALAEQTAWHEANGHFKNDEQRKAFTAGFGNGWMRLFQTMKVQGFIKA